MTINFQSQDSRGRAAGGYRTSPGRHGVLGIVLAVCGIAATAGAALPPVPRPPENPFSEEKRILGKILFFEEQMSANNAVSCATCHVNARAGADPRLANNPGPDGVTNTPDDRRASPGVPRSDALMDYLRDTVFDTRPQVTDRSANSPINAAYAPQLFWDGRASGEFKDPVTGQVLIASGGALESQSVNPPVSTAEMGHDAINWPEVIEKLQHVHPLNLATNYTVDIQQVLNDSPSYPELFRRAFGDAQITAGRIAFALATYERTLIADQTPWDAFIAGNVNALTQGQRDGWQAFQTSNCNQCHVPPLFTGNGFRNIGHRPPAEDRGLANVTGNNGDRGKFKVPSLRNTGLKASYMHTGGLPTITEVIRFYAKAPGAAPQFPDNQDQLMQTVTVPPQVAPALDDFLRNGLTDPRVRDQVFPFDRPTLAAERPQNRTTNLGGGTPGTGGLVPRFIADMPPMLGTADFRVGVDRARGSTTARLAYSLSGPSNGRITPTAIVGEVVTTPGTAGQGLGTFHWELSPTTFTSGQVIFLQWQVDDPAAAGGVALSEVARVPLFCGSWGCPGPCPADMDNSGFVDTDDFEAFMTAFEAGSDPADFDRSGFVDTDDFDTFVRAFEGGC